MKKKKEKSFPSTTYTILQPHCSCHRSQSLLLPKILLVPSFQRLTFASRLQQSTQVEAKASCFCSRQKTGPCAISDMKYFCNKLNEKLLSLLLRFIRCEIHNLSKICTHIFLVKISASTTRTGYNHTHISRE